MSNWVHGLLNKCTNYVQRRLSQPCLLCAGRALGEPVCSACRADLAWLPDTRCPRCALPTPHGEVCGACLRRPPAFSATVAVLRYGHPADILIQHLKYGGELALAGWFAGLLAERVHELPELILPMPLHSARLRERGFNQAAEIGRAVGKRLGVAVCLDACRRVRDTPSQAGLSLKERRKNIRGAFSCHADLRGRRVALLDDVMTSGASLDELAGTVLRAGAAEAWVWVLARALERRR